MADVADDRLVLHVLHVISGDDVEAARGRDENICIADHVFEPCHLVAVHGGLESTDGVDLRDDHASPLAPQRVCRTLTDVAVTEHHGDLAADERVSCTVDPIDQRVAAAVLVVELALGHRVIHVDSREQQRAVPLHVVQAQDARGGLLGHSRDASRDLREAVG